LVQQGSLLLQQAGAPSNTLLVSDPTKPVASNPWPIGADTESDVTDDLVTIYDTQGVNEGRTTPNCQRQEHPGVQVRVRSTTPLAGFKKAQQIGVALDQVGYPEGSAWTPQRTVTIPGSTATYRVFAVTRNTNIINAGKNVPNTKHSIFTINAILVLKQLT
jgi:hypothetical protein